MISQLKDEPDDPDPQKRKPSRTTRRVWNELPPDYKLSIEDQGYKINDFTCCNCGLVAQCSFAFDTYNTSGDCLAEK